MQYKVFYLVSGSSLFGTRRVDGVEIIEADSEKHAVDLFNEREDVKAVNARMGMFTMVKDVVKI